MPNLRAPLALDKLRMGEVMRRAGYPRGEAFAADLARLLPPAGLATPLRMGHLLAQLAIESDRFKAVEEYASGSAYEGRRDLGNDRPGDGVRFKGRGLIQLTGRANYAAFTKAVRAGFGCYPPDPDGPDFAADPSQVAARPWCIVSALYYWHRTGLSAVSDEGDTRRTVERVSRAVNRGSASSTKPANHENERVDAFIRYMTAVRVVFAAEIGTAPGGEVGR